MLVAAFELRLKDDVVNVWEQDEGFRGRSVEEVDLVHQVWLVLTGYCTLYPSTE